MDNSDETSDLLALTTEIVAAHVSNNTVAVGDLPQLINQVYNSLANIGSVPARTRGAAAAGSPDQEIGPCRISLSAWKTARS